MGIEAEESQRPGETALDVGEVGAAGAVGPGPDGICEAAADAEDAVGVEEGIGEQGATETLDEGDGLGPAGGTRGGEMRERPVALRGKRLHGGAVRRRVVHGIAREVGDGEPGGDGVEAPHLFAEAAQVLRRLRRRAEGQKGKDEHGKNLHGTQYSIMIRGNRHKK